MKYSQRDSISTLMYLLPYRQREFCKKAREGDEKAPLSKSSINLRSNAIHLEDKQEEKTILRDS